MFQVSPTPFSCIDWLKFQASEFQKNVSIKKLENKESVQNWVVDMGGGQRLYFKTMENMADIKICSPLSSWSKFWIALQEEKIWLLLWFIVDTDSRL